MSRITVLTLLMLTYCESTVLLNISTNTNLTVTNSPYTVTQDIFISENIILTIENGVEIIFENDYYLNIRGSIIVGCNEEDTSLITSYGLSNNNNYTYFHSQLYNDKGGIIFESKTNAYGMICNAKFEGLNTVLRTTDNGFSTLSIDNCEFTNCYQVSYFGMTDATNKQLVTDSYFYDFDSRIFGNGFIEINHCLINNVSSVVLDSQNSNVYNNDITGDYTQTCIQLGNGNNYIENNTISHCNIAIQSWGSHTVHAYIEWNVFSNNNIAIKVYEGTNYVHYNNFIGNGFNLQSGSISTDKQENFNYNYFGVSTSNQSVIAIAMTVDDLCAGTGTILFVWWPWYTHPINFTDRTNLPNQTTITTLDCRGPDNYPQITGNKLSVFYITGSITTLTSAESPYYVINNIIVEDGALINVENNVEIIFINDFSIIIKGEINMGCNQPGVINNVCDQTFGLCLKNEFTHIRSELLNDKGGFLFDSQTNANGSYCNVKFEGLKTAFDVTVNNANLLFDHCEFTNCYQVSYSFSHNHVFTNSYFYDFDSIIIGNGYTEINHCLFTNFSMGLLNNAQHVKFYNSQVIGDKTQTCIWISYGTNYIENNTINSCDTGVKISGSHIITAYIEWNLLSDNNYAISIDEGTSYTHYNNFIQNSVNVVLTGSVSQPFFDFNYWGISNLSDLSDPKLIADTILDVCDVYSTALLTFWPWSASRYIDINSVSTNIIYSFEFNNCSSINNPVIIEPSINPTQSPTYNPSDTPTQSPSDIPTKLPIVILVTDSVEAGNANYLKYRFGVFFVSVCVFVLT
eukprot:153716_1